MLKPFMEIGKGLVLSVYAAAAAPIMAIRELIASSSTFLG